MINRIIASVLASALKKEGQSTADFDGRDDMERISGMIKGISKTSRNGSLNSCKRDLKVAKFDRTNRIFV